MKKLFIISCVSIIFSQGISPSDTLFTGGSRDVSIQGDLAVVGVPYKNNKAGAAYLFKYDSINGNWENIHEFTNQDLVLDSEFGTSVKILDSLVFIAPRVGSINDGNVQIFSRNRGGLNNWGFHKKLTPPGESNFRYFGCSLDIANDVLVVGDYRDNDNGGGAGAVYLFSKNLGGLNNWGFLKKILASSDGPNRNVEDYFGYKVAIDDSILAVSAIEQDLRDINGNFGESKNGSIYIFYKNYGGIDNWGEIKQFTGSSSGYNQIGSSLDLHNDLIIAGGITGNANENQGRAFIFEKDAGGLDNWGEVRFLREFFGSFDNFKFGSSVAINDSLAFVGSSEENFKYSETGTVYTYKRNKFSKDDWGFSSKFGANKRGTELGISMDIDESRLIVGSDGVTIENIFQSAFIFKIDDKAPIIEIEYLTTPIIGLDNQLTLFLFSDEDINLSEDLSSKVTVFRDDVKKNEFPIKAFDIQKNIYKSDVSLIGKGSFKLNYELSDFSGNFFRSSSEFSIQILKQNKQTVPYKGLYFDSENILNVNTKHYFIIDNLSEKKIDLPKNDIILISELFDIKSESLNQNIKVNYDLSENTANVNASFYYKNDDYTWEKLETFRDNNRINTKFIKNGVYGIFKEAYNLTLPQEFEISQNYPNPFNPITNIDFQLPENSFVNITIFNVLGKKIKVLLNRNLGAGKHKAQWNGTNNNGFKVSSGFYFYKVTYKNKVYSNKMLLLK